MLDGDAFGTNNERARRDRVLSMMQDCSSCFVFNARVYFGGMIAYYILHIEYNTANRNEHYAIMSTELKDESSLATTND